MKDLEKLEYPEKSSKNPKIKCRNPDPLARKSRHRKQGTHKKLMKTHLRSRKTHQEYVINFFFEVKNQGFRAKNQSADMEVKTTEKRVFVDLKMPDLFQNTGVLTMEADRMDICGKTYAVQASNNVKTRAKNAGVEVVARTQIQNASCREEIRPDLVSVMIFPRQIPLKT